MWCTSVSSSSPEPLLSSFLLVEQTATAIATINPTANPPVPAAATPIQSMPM